MPKTWRFLLEKATLSGIYIVQRIGITTHKNAKIVIASDAEPPPPSSRLVFVPKYILYICPALSEHGFSSKTNN